MDTPTQPRCTSPRIGSGITARVPVSLYVDTEGTRPHRDSVGTDDYWNRSTGDRATRLAGVITTWNVFQHFYPYMDHFEIDMPGELRRALTWPLEAW